MGVIMQEINTEISEEKNEPTVEVLGEELLPIEVSAVNEAVEAEEIEEVVQAEPLVFQIGVVFENTYPPEAAVWCNENNAKIVELDPIEKEVEETYIEQVPVEKEEVIPAQIIEEIIPAQYDDDGNIVEEEKVVEAEVPEHTEIVVEFEEVEKTRMVLKTLRVFQIAEVPPYIPTVDDIKALREQAYIKEVDVLHAQKMRKMVLETWTEEDEANYISEVKARSEDIANRYPYSDEE